MPIRSMKSEGIMRICRFSETSPGHRGMVCRSAISLAKAFRELGTMMQRAGTRRQLVFFFFFLFRCVENREPCTAGGHVLEIAGHPARESTPCFVHSARLGAGALSTLKSINVHDAYIGDGRTGQWPIDARQGRSCAREVSRAFCARLPWEESIQERGT